MRIVLTLLLLSTPLCASSQDHLCAIDREICCLEKRYLSLMQEIHYLNEAATDLYWHQNTELDVRALYWRACRRCRTAHRVCCRIQKLRAVRCAIVRQAQKGVSYESCSD